MPGLVKIHRTSVTDAAMAAQARDSEWLRMNDAATSTRNHTRVALGTRSGVLAPFGGRPDADASDDESDAPTLRAVCAAVPVAGPPRRRRRARAGAAGGRPRAVRSVAAD